MVKTMIERELIGIIDIGFVGIIQVIIAFFISFALDFVLPTKGDHKTGTVFLLFEISLMVGLILIITHYVGKVVMLIPFPLVGLFGYVNRVSEWNTLPIMTVFTLIYCETIQHKIEILRRRESLFDLQLSKKVSSIANF